MIRVSWLLAFIPVATTLSASAQTNVWQWQPSLVPRARVFQGLWSEYFQIEPALHLAGLPYTCATVNLFSPADMPGGQDAVVVLGNTAASHLGKERIAQIKEFVANGGGLVVLGGLAAFNVQGGYEGTPLGEILPVKFTASWGPPPLIPNGALLTRPSSATWLSATDFSAKPVAYYVHGFTPQSNAVVQLLAGNLPAVVSGTYGKGRVVAVALTVYGDPPVGVGKMPFWEWPEWPRLLGQMIDWAAAGRPLKVVTEIKLTPVSKLKALSNDELNDFALGLKTPDNLIARAQAHPSAAVAEALFGHLTAPDAGGKLTLAQALPVLVPYAKPEWGPLLVERTQATNPNRDDRNAALVLLGASHWPNATGRLLAVVALLETKQGAIDGLGYCADPQTIPAVRRVYDDAIHASRIPGEIEYFEPEAFAREDAALATSSALALYRMGETNGVERVLEMHRHVKLYLRIFSIAARRQWRHGDGPKTIAWLHHVYDLTDRLAQSMDKLRRHTDPIPASQLAAFLKTAQIATDPEDIDWLLAEWEQSLAAYPLLTWQPLTTAKDGIIARFARAAVATNPTERDAKF